MILILILLLILIIIMVIIVLSIASNILNTKNANNNKNTNNNHTTNSNNNIIHDINNNIPFRECSRYFKSAFNFDKKRCTSQPTPAIAQLVEHLTVEWCRHQMVPGAIPGRRMFLSRCLSERYVLESRALAWSD